MTFIVECSVCGQPWEVDSPMMSAGPGRNLILQPHRPLYADRGKLGYGRCLGTDWPGLGIGARSDWPASWRTRQPMAPLPDVRAGGRIRVG